MAKQKQPEEPEKKSKGRDRSNDTKQAVANVKKANPTAYAEARKRLGR
jgi:hypothetical protein